MCIAGIIHTDFCIKSLFVRARLLLADLLQIAWKTPTHLQKLAELELNFKTCLTSKTNTFLMADVLHFQFLCHTQFHYQLANVCRQVGILLVTYLQLTQLAIASGSISRYQLPATAHSHLPAGQRTQSLSWCTSLVMLGVEGFFFYSYIIVSWKIGY